MQKKVYDLLIAKQSVTIELAENNGSGKKSEAVVVHESLLEVLKKTYLIYLAGLIFMISALSVFNRHHTTAGSVLSFFLLSSSLYLVSSAPLMSRTVTLVPLHFAILIKANYIACGALITLVHFSFIFPGPKEMFKKHPLIPCIVLYGYFFIMTLLYFFGLTGFGFSNPFLFVWTAAMIGAFAHSIIKEQDVFLRKQISLTLFAPMMATAFFVLSHILPGILGSTNMRFTYFSLLCLIMPFALPSAMDNVRLYKERLDAERNSEKEKERTRQDIHDYILNDLANISLSADLSLAMIDRDTTAVKDRLNVIRDISRDSSHQLRGFLQITNEGCSTWEDIRDYFRKHGLSMVKHLDIDFKMDMNNEVRPANPPSLSFRACLYKLFREAMTNVIKHAQADAVTARISFSDDRVVLEINDNGKGFDPKENKGGHYGLENMKKRVEEFNGDLIIESGPAQGTHVRIQLPLR